MNPKKVFLNFFLFQIGWFVCILGAANQMPWLALGIVMVIVFGQVAFANQPMKELALIVSACVVGAIVDQMFLINHVVQYQSHGWSNAVVPVWIIALWMGFSSTLNISLRWLRDRYVVAFLLGAIGGPIAYIAAEKLGAVVITPMVTSYIALALAWACVTLLLLELSKIFDGHQYV